jgi:hypothetical protein
VSEADLPPDPVHEELERQFKAVWEKYVGQTPSPEAMEEIAEAQEALQSYEWRRAHETRTWARGWWDDLTHPTSSLRFWTSR